MAVAGFINGGKCPPTTNSNGGWKLPTSSARQAPTAKANDGRQLTAA
jgi:hypothetical protein